MRKKRVREATGAGYFIREWILPIVVAFVLAWLINTFVVFRIEVPTGSMIPTINIDDKIFVRRTYFKDRFQRGDILVFNSVEENNTLLIKRLVGLPGETVELRNGILYIDGVLVEEPYVVHNLDFSGRYVVPEGHLLFFGDNRATSRDARFWDDPFVSVEEVIGVGGLRIFPFDNMGFLK